MLLVLGRPGSGCSTFLKVVGNQRSGYESIEGDVRYGGTDSVTMAKKYCSEGAVPSNNANTSSLEANKLPWQSLTIQRMISITRH